MLSFKSMIYSLFTIFVLTSFVCLVFAQDSNVIVLKSVSEEEFTWDDTVVITLTVKNDGNETINEVSIVDYLPDNFKGEPDDVVTSEGIFNITRSTILPNETFPYSYTMKGSKDLGTDLNITLRGAQVFFETENGDIKVQTSQDISVKIKTESSDENLDLVAQAVILLAATFLFGFIGSLINNMAGSDLTVVLPNSDKTTVGKYVPKTKSNNEPNTESALSLKALKDATVNKQFKVELTINPELLPEVKDGVYKLEVVLNRNTQVWRKEIPWTKDEKEKSTSVLPEITGEHSLYCRIINAVDKKLISEYQTEPVAIQVYSGIMYSVLIGGIAGMITLASLETLSAIFSDTGINLTLKAIVTLVVACLAAGFVPQKIIENYTKTLVKEKQEAEQKTDQAEQNQQKENDKNMIKSGVDDLLKKLDEAGGVE